jgi:hypothetical protein
MGVSHEHCPEIYRTAQGFYGGRIDIGLHMGEERIVNHIYLGGIPGDLIRKLAGPVTEQTGA